MQAIVMNAPGGPEVLESTVLPDPLPAAPTDIVVELKAAGVNPVDTKLRANGTYFPDRAPSVLGCDGAGVVTAVGEQVRRFQVGDPVYFCNGGIGADQGSYAEYTVLDERYAARKPESLSFEQAAAAPLVLITAWESLHERGRLGAGQRALIHAGSGGVGHVAVQLARIADARVAATVGDAERAQWVRDLGAELAISHRETDFVDAVREWSDGDGAHYALDTVGGSTFARTFEALRTYGELVTLLQPGSDVDWKPARVRNLRVGLELMLTPQARNLPDARQRQREILERCAELFDRGHLEVAVQEVFPLSDAADAHRRIARGAMRGKLVLKIRD